MRIPDPTPVFYLVSGLPALFNAARTELLAEYGVS
jgi:hypothetical protein